MTCLRPERFGDCSTAALTASTLSSILTVLGLPDDFLFSVDPIAQRLEIHSKIVFRSDTDTFGATKPLCSPAQHLMGNENVRD
ncbi:hypothetical protein Trydic_g7029 [Trypoxylus dichotomus]